MKRILTVLMLMSLCISVFAGCTQNDGNKTQFDFSCSVEKTLYARGEIIQITATVTNVSGKTYEYTGCSGNDFIPFISLYNEANKQYQIISEPFALPEDVVEKQIEDRESGSIVYSFVIPENAKLGNYSVVLSLGEDKKEYTNLLSVCEPKVQDQDDIHTEYEGIYISADSFNPSNIKVIWNNETNEQALRGESYNVEYYNSVSGKWESVMVGEKYFEAIAIGLMPKTQTEKTYSLDGFDLSRAGKYRLRCEFNPPEGGIASTWIEWEIAIEE